MKRSLVFSLRILSLALILSAAGLLVIFSITSQETTFVFPAGSTIANLPVGGLDETQAADRLRQVYDQPLQLRYQDSLIQVPPAQLGFSPDYNAWVSACRQQTGQITFWQRLWGRGKMQSCQVPAQAVSDPAAVEAYLRAEIAPRYDQPASAPVPYPGDVRYLPGRSGWSLDIPQAVPLIQAALTDPTRVPVQLPVAESGPLPPLFENLDTQLRQLVRVSGFDGIVELYLQDLTNDRIIHFALQNGQEIEPGVAFTAASTMKIPIMLSVLRRIPEPTPADYLTLLERMIVLSENPPSDTLMESIDPVSGPLMITDDLREMGFQNTFIAGFFYLGAPLLKLYETPANLRTDINVSPDLYNQTTPAEIGLLLHEIYRCAEDRPNRINTTFNGQVTPSECQLILDTLARNKIALLSEAGVPDGTRVAHKHGWIEESDGLLHTMSDAAVIYTPGSDFVFTVYIYRQEQLVFDPANLLIARMAQTAYTYFNLPPPP